jgi:hypothetical protein
MGVFFGFGFLLLPGGQRLGFPDSVGALGSAAGKI